MIVADRGIIKNNKTVKISRLIALSLSPINTITRYSA